jgi:hypothetical protein
MDVDVSLPAPRGSHESTRYDAPGANLEQAAEESGVKETAETLLVGAVLAVLAAATVFMMVELLNEPRDGRGDQRNSLAYGRSIEEVADFLCRSGTVEEVKRKAKELGLLRPTLS